jgi:DNA helicase-2/ATP-dependent DNA helicase PcrA
MEYYSKFFEDEDLYQQLMREMEDQELKEFIRSYSLDVLNSKYVELEDLAPLMYLKFHLYGVNEKIPVRHIVVDEAQDLSPFQYYALKAIIKDSSFTLLGDLGQGIHSYRGTRDWNEIMEHVFESKGQFLTLEQSYRTTIEIMEAAKKVLSRLGEGQTYLAKPVIRHGEEVKVIKKESVSAIAHEVDEKIHGFQEKGFKSIAIICKTLDECRKFCSLLKHNKEQCHIITGKEKEYKSGIVIVPSYLSKGLEFDVVMISNANAERYQENELDIKLLYVAMTRPLHILHIYYEGELSPLLKE